MKNRELSLQCRPALVHYQIPETQPEGQYKQFVFTLSRMATSCATGGGGAKVRIESLVAFGSPAVRFTGAVSPRFDPPDDAVRREQESVVESALSYHPRYV